MVVLVRAVSYCSVSWLVIVCGCVWLWCVALVCDCGVWFCVVVVCGCGV